MEDVLERLFRDEETKDVLIQMSDGVIRAHSVMLFASSDAIRGLLQHGTATQNKTLQWDDYTVEVGKFFMRLLYTESVHDDECSHENDRERSINVKRNGHDDAGFMMDWTKMEITDVSSLNLKIQYLRPGQKLLAVNGRATPDWATYKAIARPLHEFTITVYDPLSKETVPLDLLLGALSISKKYLVPHVLKSLTNIVKQRISHSTFDQICAIAIRIDLTELRLSCLSHAMQKGCQRDLPCGTLLKAIEDFSKGVEENIQSGTLGEIDEIDALHDSDNTRQVLIWESGQVLNMEETFRLLDSGTINVEGTGVSKSSLRDMYDSGQLKPEVMSELASLWGVPETRSHKKRRLLE